MTVNQVKSSIYATLNYFCFVLKQILFYFLKMISFLLKKKAFFIIKFLVFSASKRRIAKKQRKILKLLKKYDDK